MVQQSAQITITSTIHGTRKGRKNGQHRKGRPPQCSCGHQRQCCRPNANQRAQKGRNGKAAAVRGDWNGPKNLGNGHRRTATGVSGQRKRDKGKRHWPCGLWHGQSAIRREPGRQRPGALGRWGELGICCSDCATAFSECMVMSDHMTPL